MKRFFPAILIICLMAVLGIARAADWSNPNPQSGPDTAGQLLLKHESNMTDLYSSPSGKLNLLRKSFVGVSAPSLPEAGQLWCDSSASPYLVKSFSGTDWTTVKFYNADLLDGYNTATAGTANTICLRDASGDIAANALSATTTVTAGTTVTATGNVTGSQLISTIAAGTAPLTVTSTTKVANLNADTVDGYNTSATVAANTVPVRDVNGNIGGGPGLVGELSNNTATNATDLDLGTVVTGDLIFVESYIGANTGTIALPFIMNRVTKISGTAVIITVGGGSQLIQTALSGSNNQEYVNTISGIFKVTTGGTLTFRGDTSTGGTVGANRLSVFFLKKQ